MNGEVHWFSHTEFLKWTDHLRICYSKFTSGMSKNTICLANIVDSDRSIVFKCISFLVNQDIEEKFS